MEKLSPESIKSSVRDRYSKIALENDITDIQGCGCAATDQCCQSDAYLPEDVSMKLGYSEDNLQSVPKGSNMGLACGNPHLTASFKKGEIVLDLGSGGGFDCFLAAQAVGPAGKVIGVDMTPAMVHKARANAGKTDFDNVEFRLGEIDHLPVADNSVDIIMSNCVINLSPEKKKVYSEALRVLKPLGRLAISDVLALKDLPESIRNDVELLGACIGGAETVRNTRKILLDLGFEQVKITIARESSSFIDEFAPASKLSSYVASATIEAFKPE